jgi:hypothetical protein
VILPPITDRQMAAIMAGLRLLQHDLLEGRQLPDGIEDILTNGESFQPLEAGQRLLGKDPFDVLCERINRHTR